MHWRRRSVIILGVAVALASTTACHVGAQTPAEVTKSLCGLFNRKQMRTAFEQRVGFSDEDPGKCHWGLVDPGAYGGQLELELAWEPVAFDDQDLVTPDATDLTVGGRRARFLVREGDVIVVGEGQVKRDIYSDLVLDLDEGPLGLHLTDVKGQDRQAMLVGLGESAVAKAARLVAPPPLDAVLASFVPATIDAQPTVIQRVLYPAQEFCSRCDFGKALRAVLKAQGKTMADVSMLSAATAAQSAPDSFQAPTIRALRVPGMDASAFVEPMIGYLFGGTGVTPERTEGVGVVAVTRRGDQYNPEWTAVLYPKDDILWVVTAPEQSRAEVLAALPGAPVPPPIPTPAPTPTPDISTPEGYLKSLMPASIGGEPLSVQVTGPGWVAAMDKATVKWLKSELKKVGKTVDDLSSLVAFTSSGSQLVALLVPGVDVAPLVDHFVASQKATGGLGKKTEATPVEISGKGAFSVQGATGTTYLYPKDDVLWVVEVPDAVLAETFAALP